MYRAPDTTPRCPLCGATDLTPVTRFDHSADGSPVMIFTPRGAQPGFLGVRPTIQFPVDRACACLSCGHVMLGFSPEQLADLRAKLGSLEPRR